MSVAQAGAILTVVIIPSLAIFVPAILGLYYFRNQRRYEQATLTNAISEEMHRLKHVLAAHLLWIDKPTSAKLPLLPFETAVYDAQLEKLGMLSPDFAKSAVSFYGLVHFINALQRARVSYNEVNADDQFVRSYKKAIENALKHARESGAKR